MGCTVMSLDLSLRAAIENTSAVGEAAGATSKVTSGGVDCSKDPTPDPLSPNNGQTSPCAAAEAAASHRLTAPTRMEAARWSWTWQ